MTLEEYTQIVSTVLSPALLLTASVFLMNFVANRIHVVAESIRRYNTERIGLAQTEPQLSDERKTFMDKRVRLLEEQFPPLFYRMKLLQRALLLILSDMGCFVLSMMLNGGAVLGSPWMFTASLVLLYIGIMLLFVAVFLILLEARQGGRTLEREVSETSKQFFSTKEV